MTSFAILRTCYRCTGTGQRPEFSHVEDGKCFGCDGAGVRPWATRDIREHGWKHTTVSTRRKFVQYGIVLLSCAGHEGAPTAAGWKDAVVEHLKAVLPFLTPFYFEAAVEAIQEVHTIDSTWVEENRPQAGQARAA